MSLTPAEIASIERIVRASRLAQVRIDQDGESVVIGDGAAAAPAPVPGLVAVAAPAVGSISFEKVAAGHRVEKGAPLARLRVLETTTPIVAPARGRIAAIVAEEGGLVAYGEEVILLETEGAP